MAKVQKKGAATRTRRRERKNIEKGAAHIRSLFQQHDRYHYRPER